MEDIKKQLFTTPILRVLDVLFEISRPISDADVIENVKGAGRSAAHAALVQLSKMGITKRTNQGKRCINEIETQHPWISPFKLTLNLMNLSDAISFLKECASKIVLFGSRAEGTNKEGSDYDLLVVANDAQKAISLLNQSSLSEKIQMMIKTPEEMLSLEKENPVLYSAIKKGIVLWQK